MIQAAMYAGTDKVYVFRGDQYAVYDPRDEKLYGGKAKTIADGWPGLRDTQFASDLDAAFDLNYEGASILDPRGFAHLFKGDQYVKYDVKNDKTVYGPNSIADDWPGLAKAGFDRDLDAAGRTFRMGAMTTSYMFYFFKGDQYVRFDKDQNKVVVGPKRIADGWPGLKEAGFDRDLDAVLFGAKSPAIGAQLQQYAYFFKGGRYLKYDYDNARVIGSVRSIADGWPGLKGLDFAAAEEPPARAPIVAHADCTITFSNPGESEPDPFGKVWLKTKDGTLFRLWTQANLGNDTPARSKVTNRFDLPFTADAIAEVCADVDEYDIMNPNDYLARGSTPFKGNGTYVLKAEDGSVTVELAIS